MNNSVQSVVLNNGVLMPLIGLGTYKIQKSSEVNETIRMALECCYRSFDSAKVYNNERDIGIALKQYMPNYNLKRSDVFLTSKLAPESHGFWECEKAFEKSLHEFDMEYLDLFLIHWPGVQGRKSSSDTLIPELRRESWLQMEKIYESGKVKAIGISNYTLRHMKELLSFCTVKPAVLQIECHPYLQQIELQQFCQKENIHLQAYSSLGTSSHTDLLNNQTIGQIATKHARTSAQILLRWGYQQGIGVIPKSVHAEYVKSNINILDFNLDDDDLDKIKQLNKEHHYCWNPDNVI